MPPRLYLETTIPSYLVARPSRDALMRGMQVATRRWWDGERQNYELFVSEFVEIEAAQGDAEMAAERVRTIEPLPRLPVTESIRQLTAAILATGLIGSGCLAYRRSRRAWNGYVADVELHAHSQHRHQPADRANLHPCRLSVSGHLHTV